ncbi:MAG: hypothetical protein NTU85_01640 [Candidatus Kaiserbacteria bacterium]|nr:hypothetical protein [Candidatus Kaiserbacteria bacterium]
MPIFFTLVKKDSIKIGDFISQMLMATPKNTETREISGTVIRDIEAKIV